MRNETLEQLVEKVRAECRLSTNTSRGIDNSAYIKQVINRCYEELYDNHDWQHLRIDRSVEMQAGQRYYDYPDDLNLEYVEKIWVQHGQARFNLAQGIDPTLYNSSDSPGDERASHPIRFDYHQEDDGSDQFEVWPVPAENDSDATPVLVIFRGKKNFNELVNNTDRCLIDTQLVVLSAAADILSDNKSPGAQRRADKVSARLSRLKSRYAPKRRCISGLVEPSKLAPIPQLRVSRHE